jgi:predicted Rossmann-fold nucleotide-binding protein
MIEPVTNQITVAVFASDRGPGDAERASLMTQAGNYFARRGARILTLAEDGVVPVTLITAARTAGGAVEVVADASIHLPPVLADVPIHVAADAAERQALIASQAQALVGLPGSLASATALFATWAAARQQGRVLPVVLLNRHRAFEVVRGFSADVLSHSLRGHERALQFADTVEDLWTRTQRLVQGR